MRLNRKKLRRLLEEEQLRIIIEKAEKEKRKSEMRQFSESKGGRAVMNAGSKIASAGRSIREIAENHTGNMRETLENVSNFVEGLGASLSGLNSLNEGESSADMMPTVAEYKNLQREIKRLEK